LESQQYGVNPRIAHAVGMALPSRTQVAFHRSHTPRRKTADVAVTGAPGSHVEWRAEFVRAKARMLPGLPHARQ
jgi:hypothetical protein